MFIDITKLDRKQVKEIVLSAGWWWDAVRAAARAARDAALAAQEKKLREILKAGEWRDE